MKTAMSRGFRWTHCNDRRREEAVMITDLVFAAILTAAMVLAVLGVVGAGDVVERVLRRLEDR